MHVEFKIPTGLASHLCCKRELRNVYQTNRAVKLYGFFALLKTITNSGVIKNYHECIEEIGQLTKKSRTGVYSYLSKARVAGLLRIANRNIYLTSWEAATELVDCAYYSGKYTVLSYDTTLEKQTPEYLIYAAEIKENQEKQTRAVIEKIGNTPSLASLLGVKQIVTSDHVEQLQKLQVLTFVNGGADHDYSLIHSIRADVQRTAATLRREYGFKSRRGVKYLKLQLRIRGVAKIASRVLESENRSRVNKNLMYTGYVNERESTFWKQPDLISLNVAQTRALTA